MLFWRKEAVLVVMELLVVYWCLSQQMWVALLVVRGCWCGEEGQEKAAEPAVHCKRGVIQCAY